MTRIGSVLTSLAACSCLVACSQKVETPFSQLIEQAHAATARGDLTNARAKLNEVVTLSEQAEDDLATVRALNDLAEIEKKEDHAEKLRSLYEKAGKICDIHVSISDTKSDEDWLREAVRTCSGLGQVYSNLGSFATAQSYFEKAIEFEERIDMPAEMRKVQKEYDQLLKTTMQEKLDVDIANKDAMERSKRKREIQDQISKYLKESPKRQPAENQRILEELSAKLRAALGVHDYYYLRSRELLYSSYFDSGQYTKARSLIERDLDTFREDEENYLSGKKIDEETVMRIERLESQLALISPCYVKEKKYADAKRVVDRRIKMLERLQLPQWSQLALAYSENSNLCENLGKIPEAVDYSLKAIQLFNRDPKLYRVHLRERYRVLAFYYAKLDKPKESAEAGKRFLSYAGNDRLFPFEIQALLSAASSMLKLKQYNDAVITSERAANAALQLDAKTEDQLMLDYILEASDICYTANDCKTAEKILGRAAKVMEPAQKFRLSNIYEHLGEIRARCKDWQNAIPAYKKAITIRNAHYPKDAGFAGTNNKLAYCYVMLNRCEEAVLYFKDSAQACKRLQNKEPYQSTSLQLAEPLRMLNRRAEARVASLEAAKYSQPKSINSMRYAMSGYCTAVGDSLSLNLHDQALKDYTDAKAFYEKHKAQLDKSDETYESAFWLGADAKYLHRYDESLGYFQKWYDLSKSRGESALLARCLANMAFVSEKLGATEKAKELKRKCEAMRVRLKLSVDDVYEKQG